jgi:ubiquinone biosynthesis protein UbiJ
MATVEKITAPKVQQALQEHLQRHELKLDGKLHDVYHAVFGEQGKGGICDEVERVKSSMERIDERLEKIEGGINKVLWTVGLAVIAAILKLVFIP